MDYIYNSARLYYSSVFLENPQSLPWFPFFLKISLKLEILSVNVIKTTKNILKGTFMQMTPYGTEDLQILLQSFGKLGESILSGEITEEITDVNKKKLRLFKTKEACKMIDRSDTFLKNLEKADPSFTPTKINGIRYYDLKLINRIRDKAGTRYRRPQNSYSIKIAITNFKGGVGKSGTAKALADNHALQGLRVLLLELDPQGTTSLFSGFNPELGVKAEQTIKTALLENPKNIKQLIQKTYFPGIDIIPGNLSLTDVEIKLNDYREQMPQVKKLGFPDERLANAIQYIEDDYDVIIFDCGPNLNILTLNAINAANSMIVPVPPALPDLASFCTFCTTLKGHLENSDKIKSLEFFRVLITKHPKNRTADKMSSMMIREFGSYVMQKYIVHSAEIELAASKFSSIYELPPNSKKTYKRAIESMNNVFDEIFDAMKTIWENQEAQMSIKAEESKELENV